MAIKVFSVINQKGGVGKTTTVQALAAGLTLRGYKVLMIDLDPQGNLSATLNARRESVTIYEVLKDNININEAIKERLPWGNLIPAHSMLATVNVIPSNGMIVWTLSASHLKKLI